jgi:hypothetical protein
LARARNSKLQSGTSDPDLQYAGILSRGETSGREPLGVLARDGAKLLGEITILSEVQG